MEVICTKITLPSNDSGDFSRVITVERQIVSREMVERYVRPAEGQAECPTGYRNWLRKTADMRKQMWLTLITVVLRTQQRDLSAGPIPSYPSRTVTTSFKMVCIKS